MDTLGDDERAAGSAGSSPSRAPEPESTVGMGARAQAVRIVSTFCAMAGWRLEHLNRAWVIGGLASIGLAHVLIDRADWRFTLPYLALTLIFYYGGNAVILCSRIPARAVARWGEEGAFRRYETVAGLMFLNQGLGVGCMSALHLPRWESAVPVPVMFGAGVVLFGAGVIVKLWATLTVGVDIYFFRDMFLRRALAPASVDGPYRFLRNPMYSLGQLQGYGYALMDLSLPGVLAAAAGQLLVYAFYYAAERPFVHRVYGTRKTAESS